ncbi:MAG TPA: cysteine desulfurase family protein [Acidimicrobiales bacterium]
MPAYLDHAATTPMRPEALEVLGRVLTETYGNPSGAHLLARAARRVLDDARETMAAALGADPGEIVFTSGGTEADNLAIFGARDPDRTVLCSAIEHHAVLHPVESLGGGVVPVDARGVVDLDALADALGEHVGLVSIMLANNESGVIQPLAEVARLVRERAPHAVLHTDAVQAFPWLDVATLARDADLISVSAHKFGGPKGVGALVVRRGIRLRAMLLGGGQERDLRSGTQNVAGIASMAAAAEVTVATRAETVARVGALRDRLADGLRDRIDGTHESGVFHHDRSHKVAGSCHLCFEDIESEALLFLLERHGVYASAASSCSSGAQEPSHVLAAMGVPRTLAQGSLRLSLGWPSTDDDVDLALEAVPAGVEQLRKMAGALT